MFGHLSYFRLISNNNFVPLTKTKDEVDWNSIGENDSFTTEYNEDKITQAFTQQDLILNSSRKGTRSFGAPYKI